MYMNKHILEDMNTISFSTNGSFDQVKQIYNSLTKKEKSYFHRFIEGPHLHLVFRNIAFCNGEPIGFIEGYDNYYLNKREYVGVGIAVKSSFRGYGIAGTLIKSLVDWVRTHKPKEKDHNWYAVVYGVNHENSNSIKAVKKAGFLEEPNRPKNTNNIAFYHPTLDFMDKKKIELKKEHGKFKTPQEFNEYLNKFAYGLVDVKRSTVYSNPTEKQFNDIYKVLDPDQFLKFKAGVCWDYVVYEYMYFNENFPYYRDITAWFATDEYCQSHTWLTYKDFYSQICVFESSWKPERGIMCFSDDESMKQAYKKKLRASWVKDIKTSKDFYIRKYYPKETIHLNMNQFLQFMERDGELKEY